MKSGPEESDGVRCGAAAQGVQGCHDARDFKVWCHPKMRALPMLGNSLLLFTHATSCPSTTAEIGIFGLDWIELIRR